MGVGMFFEMVMAIFAVFGLCSLIKLTAEALIGTKRYAVAVICDEKTDPREIGFLVNRARTAWHRRGAGQTVLLIIGECRLPEETERALRDGNIQIYRVPAEPGAEEE